MEDVGLTSHSPVPGVDALVTEIIGRVADKWTLLLLEALEDHGTQRFSALARLVPSISQKMLTQSLRQMERDGLVWREVHPVIPPHVDYGLTPLGESLSDALCSLWHWAEDNHREVAAARAEFDARD